MAFSSYSSITIKELLEITTEYDILNYYLNIQQIPTIINSPLRVDKNPSFSIYSKDGIKLYFYDFGTKESGGTFDLLMLLWGESLQKVINRIVNDLPHIITNNRDIKTSQNKGSCRRIYKKGLDFQVKVREWKDWDVQYWEQFGINLEWLKFGDIYPISQIIFTQLDNNYTFSTPADKYAYVYVEFKDNKSSIKVYQPYSLTHKWMSKHDGSVWDLWAKLPQTGETLIITKSRKDALSIWRNTTIPSTALQGETYLPKQHVVDELKNRFDNVFVLYDNDYDKEFNYGREYSKVIADTYNITQIEIPTELYTKDASDLYKKYGSQQQKETILSLIKDKNKSIN